MIIRRDETDSYVGGNDGHVETTGKETGRVKATAEIKTKSKGELNKNINKLMNNKISWRDS